MPRPRTRPLSRPQRLCLPPPSLTHALTPLTPLTPLILAPHPRPSPLAPHPRPSSSPLALSLTLAPHPQVKAELRGYKGVGAKTISCVLMFCLGRHDFPVDTHVWKIAIALGWVPKVRAA